MNPIEIQNKALEKKISLLDVREKDEWDEGHIMGAIHIPISDLSENTDKLDKNIPVYVYCYSGGRAGSAKIILEQIGFKEVINMGGIIHWLQNGGELVK